MCHSCTPELYKYAVLGVIGQKENKQQSYVVVSTVGVDCNYAQDVSCRVFARCNQGFCLHVEVFNSERRYNTGGSWSSKGLEMRTTSTVRSHSDAYV
jgi:hypothetical protein